jgi:hypothetical protein
VKQLFSCLALGGLLLLAFATKQEIKLPGKQFAGWPKQSANFAAAPQVQPVSARELSGSAPEIESAPAPSDAELELAMENIGTADVLATLDSLASSTEPTATELRKRLVRRWAENDPAAAATWATQFPEGEIRNTLLEQIALARADADLADAVTWLTELPTGESKHVAMLATAYEAARTDPVVALELAATLPPTRIRDELLVHAVSQWAGTDFAAAADWIGNIPEITLREELFAAAATAAATEHASDAATLIAGVITADDPQARAAVAIIQRWAQTSPTAAAAWLEQFPELPMRGAAVENLVGLWAQSDSPAAARWVSSLPSGSLRDSALHALEAVNPAQLY